MSDRSPFFQDSAWTAGAVGPRYVRLPLAVAAAHKGLGVVGSDAAIGVAADLTRRIYRRGLVADDIETL